MGLYKNKNGKVVSLEPITLKYLSVSDRKELKPYSPKVKIPKEYGKENGGKESANAIDKDKKGGEISVKGGVKSSK